MRILILTGPGKGKTTSALGMILRALGHSQTVHLIRFMKADHNAAELRPLKHLPGITIHTAGIGFLPPGADTAPHRAAAQKALQLFRASTAHMIVLDEACTALSLNLIEESELFASPPPCQTLILTGRGAPQALIARADTVSRIENIKHGYSANIPAQPGIEF